jgi:hypothetical protein
VTTGGSSPPSSSFQILTPTYYSTTGLWEVEIQGYQTVSVLVWTSSSSCALPNGCIGIEVSNSQNSGFVYPGDCTGSAWSGLAVSVLGVSYAAPPSGSAGWCQNSPGQYEGDWVLPVSSAWLGINLGSASPTYLSVYASTG